MGKKGKGKKKKKSGPVGPSGETFLENYKKACKLIGEQPSQDVITMVDEMLSNGQILSQLCLGNVPLGPAGVRCIAAALMGELPGMEGGLYLNLTNLQFWHCGAKDAGAAALAKLMTNQNKDFKIGVLDLMDNAVGLRGCAALGKCLKEGANTSLLTLNLNANRLDAECVAALAEGLISNTTLKRLCLEYCGLGPDSGPLLAGIIASKMTGLGKLLLRGNQIRCEGLRFLSVALRKNKILTLLDLEDNEIGGFPPTKADLKILQAFAAHLSENQTLTTLNLNQNPIMEMGGETLKEGLATNKTITALKVDINLPTVLFDALCRSGGGKKKGKKKKKKK